MQSPSAQGLPAPFPGRLHPLRSWEFWLPAMPSAVRGASPLITPVVACAAHRASILRMEL